MSLGARCERRGYCGGGGAEREFPWEIIGIQAKNWRVGGYQDKGVGCGGEGGKEIPSRKKMMKEFPVVLERLMG